LPISSEEKAKKLLEQKQKEEVRKAKAARKIKAINSALRQEQNKVRIHELIQLGGLVRMVFGEDTPIDKGYLTGALLYAAKVANTPDKEQQRQDWKRQGDAEITRREAEKEARRQEARKGAV
jgi:DNA segregation ATPase FtsK/SpoIIIE-like protein